MEDRASFDSSGPVTTRNNCYTCRLFVRNINGSTSDYCKYLKMYLNVHRACKYYTDINGPSRNFKKDFGKGHTRGKGFATF